MDRPTFSDATEELRRELRVRTELYPKWILSGKIEAELAEHRIQCIRLALANLEDVSKIARVITSPSFRLVLRQLSEVGQAKLAEAALDA